MGRRTARTLNAGFTFVESLVGISITMVVLIGALGGYVSFSKAQQRSLYSASVARDFLSFDQVLREKTFGLKVPYWENPMEKVVEFVSTMYEEGLEQGVHIVKTEYLFRSSGSIAGIEFQYKLHDDSTLYTSKCIFSFYSILNEGRRG